MTGKSWLIPHVKRKNNALYSIVKKYNHCIVTKNYKLKKLMRNQYSVMWRFLLPIIILLVVAPIVFFKYLTSQQLQLIKSNARNQANSLVHIIAVADQFWINKQVLKTAINQTKTIKGSVVLVLDQEGQIYVHSDNISFSQAKALITSPNKDWVLVKAQVASKKYRVVIAFSLEEARRMSINQLMFLIVASSILGIALLLIIIGQLKRLILNPIGADPIIAINVLQRIAKGDLAQDNLQAKPGTLMANLLTMRTQLHESIHLLQDNAKRLSLSASVFDNAHDGIFITDIALKIMDVNPAFTKITGYAQEAVMNQHPKDLGFAFHDVDFFEKISNEYTQNSKWRGEVWNLHNDGNVYAAWLDIFAVFDQFREITHFVGLFSDITEVKVQQKNLEHMAYHDSLTQLPNRTFFSEQLKNALFSTDIEKELLAICYFDLDGFKPVNDNLGHEAGDFLLVNIAKRVRDCLHENDTIARLGGDEFAVLLRGLNSKEACAATLDRLIDVIKQPYEIMGEIVNISASIGYTLYPIDLSEPDTLLRHADHAMYHVKVHGRGFHHQFDAEQDRKSHSLMQEREAIANALIRKELILHYQPKVNLRSGQVVGLEALIRWQHPEQGLRVPAEFLAILEEDTEAAVKMGEWVISEALRQLTVWETLGLVIKISVNISAKHMMQANFSSRLAILLNEFNEISPALLEFEITETAAINDIADVAKTITACKKLGVSFALDDFGVGYSSLTYLRRLPVEVIKIDQSFIRDMLQDKDDLAVVSGVLSLGHSFGLEVVAEGVETAEHGVQLMKMGCEIAQGYGISKPIAAEKVVAWVNAYQPDISWVNFNLEPA